MNFEKILQEILADCPGALALALMEADGIPISQVQAATGPSDPLGGDIGAAGVEFRNTPRVVMGTEGRELLAADFRDPDGNVLSITGWRQVD